MVELSRVVAALGAWVWPPFETSSDREQPALRFDVHLLRLRRVALTTNIVLLLIAPFDSDTHWAVLSVSAALTACHFYCFRDHYCRHADSGLQLLALRTALALRALVLLIAFCGPQNTTGANHLSVWCCILHCVVYPCIDQLPLVDSIGQMAALLLPLVACMYHEDHTRQLITFASFSLLCICVAAPITVSTALECANKAVHERMDERASSELPAPTADSTNSEPVYLGDDEDIPFLYAPRASSNPGLSGSNGLLGDPRGEQPLFLSAPCGVPTPGLSDAYGLLSGSLGEGLLFLSAPHDVVTPVASSAWSEQELPRSYPPWEREHPPWFYKPLDDMVAEEFLGWRDQVFSKRFSSGSARGNTDSRLPVTTISLTIPDGDPDDLPSDARERIIAGLESIYPGMKVVGVSFSRGPDEGTSGVNVSHCD